MSTWDSKGTDLVDNIEVDSYSTNGDMATKTQDLLIGSTNKTTQGLWRKPKRSRWWRARKIWGHTPGLCPQLPSRPAHG